jgi:hypothetical protein
VHVQADLDLRSGSARDAHEASAPGHVLDEELSREVVPSAAIIDCGADVATEQAATLRGYGKGT